LKGSPVTKIIEAAKDEKVDLIVVGNKNHSGFHKFFLGSISNDVISKSEVPVLVVK